LHSAACKGRNDICSLLLEKGADIAAINKVSDA
jgi:ankyrin repeat protein